MLEAIELALATAYKKEYGKKGQIVRCVFDINSGKTEFYQVKVVVDRDGVIMEDEEDTQDLKNMDRRTSRSATIPEHHIFIEDAKRIKKDAKIGDEMIFPLEIKADYGRIAAQTAKQVIIQKIREAEKVSVLGEYGQKQGEIVTGTVQRVERGTIFVDMGRAMGIIPYEEQIPSERYKQGERIRGLSLRRRREAARHPSQLSRAHPDILAELFKMEAPEIAQGHRRDKSRRPRSRLTLQSRRRLK